MNSTGSSETATGNQGHRSIENSLDAWRTFAAPRTEGEFYQAWLALLCEQLSGVSAGVILLRSNEANTFLPAAIWPATPRDLSFLGSVAERSLTEKRGVIHRPDLPSNTVHVAYPLEVSQRMLGAVVLEATDRAEAEVAALLRQIHWGIAWLHDWFHRRELASYETKTERIGSAMEVLATGLRNNKLQQTLFDVANQIGQHLHCSRVAIGLAQDDALRVQALSNAAWFEKNASIMKLYVSAMEEAYDRMAPFAYERPADSETSTTARSAHARLATESGAQVIFSVPLRLGAAGLGVITLERDSREPFDQMEIDWIDSIVNLLPAVIDQKRRSERGVIALLRDDARALMTRLFGPKHLIWKFGASLVVIFVALMILVDIDYRVSAKTVIEGEVQRSAVAPFEGFLAAAYVRAGDVVRQGQVLCVLDDRDLRLEQSKWASERAQRVGQLREAMAKQSLADIQIFQAQVHQSEAQLALVTERIARARVTAPFDGIVISGDMSQLIGSPVEQGKKLFEVAPLHAYRVILQVDEKEVRHVRVGQAGKAMIAGIASDPISFSVSKVTPIATAQDGRNYFRVEAQFKQAPPRLRPGMEGVGKVSVGDRRLWWVLTHTFTDWLRITLWNWLP
jgi:hypothetical protein